MGVWRWRRCPQCSQVAPAGAFAYVGRYAATWGANGGAQRRCPNCGHTAPTWKFGVVREKHAVGRETA
jgi:hypothetical protein